MATADGEKASGKDKSDIYAVLAQLIFAHHPKYGSTYNWNPNEFCDSVANHIVGLKNRYKKLKARLSTTGAGVLPAEICAKWKWFADLDAIWHSNPSFVVTSHSSRPGVDHAAQMYSLVGTSTAVSSRQSQTTLSSHGYPPIQFQSTTAHCSHNSPDVTTTTSRGHNDSPDIATTTTPHHDNIQIDPRLLQPPHALPDTPSTPLCADTPSPPSPPSPPIPAAQVHLPGLSHTDDDMLGQPDPFTSPLGDALDYLRDNDTMQDDDNDNDAMQEDSGILNSPPKVVGKKQQIFASPSPSPPPDSQPFHLPTKEPTTVYHSCVAFAQGQHKPTFISCSISTPSSTTHNTSSAPSTPQTSLSAQGSGSTKKKKLS
ncbi:hypothetical protein BDR07DRAFT_1492762 [Suillus spraguei]|nr:hypothetical protein BDR07DRAFT_1492762 [Suillus spraguei]